MNLVLAYVLVLYGVMFLTGSFHEERKEGLGFFRRMSVVIDPDKLFFGQVKNSVILVADILAFWNCILNAILTGGNGVLAWAFEEVPNISAIFMFLGLFGTWILRFAFIAVFRHRDSSQIPKIWPNKWIGKI